mmetsp:Transcript_10956/g.19261  ORF Transcript_10956/g.19261 Transcript_10956/m.19261 type:complete len:248 (+) Transcript_10956:778-1521(+)
MQKSTATSRLHTFRPVTFSTTYEASLSHKKVTKPKPIECSFGSERSFSGNLRVFPVCSRSGACFLGSSTLTIGPNLLILSSTFCSVARKLKLRMIRRHLRLRWSSGVICATVRAYSFSLRGLVRSRPSRASCGTAFKATLVSSPLILASFFLLIISCLATSMVWWFWWATIKLCTVALLSAVVTLAASTRDGAVSNMIFPAGVTMCSSALNSWSSFSKSTSVFLEPLVASARKCFLVMSTGIPKISN